MWRVAAFLALFPSTLCTAASQEDYEKYVFSVRIAPESGKPFLQTGFRLSGRKGIFTALHGVVKGKWLSAANKHEKVKGGLQIRSVDVAHDLAVLGSDDLDSEDAEGLQAGSDSPTHSPV